MRRKVFEDFTSFFNNELGELPVPPMPEGRLEQSFNRHFLGDRQKAGVRMSNLGKPAIVNALNKLGYSEPDPKGMLKYIFLLGDVFENSLEMFLQSYGFNIVSSQGLVEWGGIKGSYDFIIEKDGVQTLVEAKTMSGNYSRTFATNPNDDRGYVTQLALYSDATGIPGMWLCMDKSTGMMFAVEPNPSAMQMSLTRAEKILSRLENVNTLSDVLKYFKAPPGREEVYKKNPSGKLIIPSSMAWSPFRSAVYKITLGENGYKKPTNYIYDVADEEHMQAELNHLVETGVLNYG